MFGLNNKLVKNECLYKNIINNFSYRFSEKNFIKIPLLNFLDITAVLFPIYMYALCLCILQYDCFLLMHSVWTFYINSKV